MILSAEQNSRSVAIAPPLSSRHLPVLDGLRGLAILAVLFFHLAPRTPAYFGNLVFGLGWCGVDLFFVLSGFLITGILLDAKASDTHYFRNFFARRILRIFPLYYGLLIFLFALAPLVRWFPVENARHDQAWFWLYGVNIADALKTFPYKSLNHLWSLAVEEQFYLVWPFVILWLSPKTFARVCCLCIASAFALRLVFAFEFDLPVFAYTLTPCRVDGLACGALIALALRNPDAWLPIGFWTNRKLWFLCGALLLLLSLATHDTTFMNPWMVSFGCLFFSGFFAASLANVVCSPPALVSRALTFPPLTILGKYSYGIYLLHPLVRAPLAALFQPQSIAAAWLFFLMSIICTCAVAAASYHFYESRFLRLKRFFSNRAQPSPRPQVPASPVPAIQAIASSVATTSA